MRLILLISIMLLTACTAAPMVALMGYDKAGKRDRWHEYADKGDVYAQYELAQSYCCRISEGALNPEEAVKWWCLAAKNGSGKAQFQLGKFYEHKETIETLSFPYDPVRAYMYYELAERRGSEEARNHQKLLETKLTEEQKATSVKLLKNWKELTCEAEKAVEDKPLAGEAKAP
ncbi:MAG: hypothetical protein GC136_03460 [Alphaproteobacteria bacterium]|nr:hypothetical protein [Alphaproteobacteria bacterium]